MSGAQLVARLDGTEFTGAVRQLQRLGADLTPIHAAIAMKLAENTRDRMDQEKAPDGTPWAPLNPLYVKDKKGPGILREAGMSGGLQGSITGAGTAEAAIVGSNKIQAAVHQFGAVIRAVNAPALAFTMGGQSFVVQSVTIPARPYLGLSAEDREDAEDVVLGHVARLLQ